MKVTKRLIPPSEIAGGGIQSGSMRCFRQDWSQYLDRVRVGAVSEIDLQQFAAIIVPGDDNPAYTWLTERLENAGNLQNALAVMNGIEIIVGTHAEREAGILVSI